MRSREPEMIDLGDQQPASVAPPTNQRGIEGELSAKRRRLRKGTRSCWECKRRKIRCMFASSGDATCVGCQSRRVRCVPQDVPEDPPPVKKDSRRLGERIARVENILKDCIATSKNVAVETGQTDGREFGRERASHSARPTPNPQHASRDSHGVWDQSETETARRHLFAALPTREDVEILLRQSSKPSRYTHLINTQPHSRWMLETLSAPCPIAAAPPRLDIHPVSLARVMLIFAITLQSPSGESGAQGLSETPGVLMRRLVAAARTWVTAKEEMLGSLDYLLCIILEGVYETNSGHLRRAWAVFRRAMAVAQLMGLHRSPVPPVRRIDPELDDASPEFMWFRIVYMDRYLSLLLGLPQGTHDKRMGAMAALLRHESALGKFERMLTVVAARVLERNESPFCASQISTTQSLDAELLAVSRSVPASFWRAPNFHNLTPGSPQTLLETTRLAAHVYYHGLLIQLHLPYMMRIGDDNVASHHDYSKATCVNSSREILSRFVAHRNFNPSSSCSRPVDFFALLAAMTLLLAHLDAHHRHHHHHHRDATNILAHQRLSDRAMLDQALERMHAIGDMNSDATAEKSAQLIRQLLDIESDAAEGSSYYTTESLEGDDDDGVRERPRREEGGGGGGGGGGGELHLNIPHLGVIKIARQGRPIVARERPAGDTLLLLRRPHTTSSQAEEVPQREPPPGASCDDDALASLSSHAAGPDEQDHHLGRPPPNAPLLHSPCPEQSSVLQCPNATTSHSHDSMVPQGQVGLAPVAAGVDDWAVQGVDMAFFDGLIMRGTACPDAPGWEP